MPYYVCLFLLIVGSLKQPIDHRPAYSAGTLVLLGAYYLYRSLADKIENNRGA